MFTGLVEGLGTVADSLKEGAGVRLRIAVPWDSTVPTALGASIAVNGCCLTVVEIAGDTLDFQAGPETLRLTNLGSLNVGDRVNLERSLKLGDELGGHLVSGHVDALGQVDAIERTGEWVTLRFAFPPRLAGQLAPKGSVTVNGCSLTVVDVEPSRFGTALIPHTLAVTNLGMLRVGDAVNLETDLLAKYVERQLAWRNA